MIELIAKTGAILIGTSDSHGGIYDSNGLDIAQIVELKKNKKSLSEYTGATQITNAELLELDCDILIPAALENQITSDNAQNIKAKLILELANGPITPDADRVLFSK
jgi:glutamate dehydrogenase/leucine dehydrogenase